MQNTDRSLFIAGNRQTVLPGSGRTGAPGRHVIRGKAKYEIDDTKVRIFVAPPPHVLETSDVSVYNECNTRVSTRSFYFQLKPYVTANAKLSEKLEKRFMKGRKGLMGRNYLRMLKLKDLKAAQQQAAALPPLLRPISM
jgi:large subunit ribosomal protein L41